MIGRVPAGLHYGGWLIDGVDKGLFKGLRESLGVGDCLRVVNSWQSGSLGGVIIGDWSLRVVIVTGSDPSRVPM